MGRHSKRRRGRGLFAFGAVAGAATSLAAQGTANADTPTGPPGGWSPVIKCESNFNPRAQNPESSASGLVQFTTGTWRSNGGGRYAKRAKDATPEQQMKIAAVTFQRRGLNPWEASQHCWDDEIKAAKRRGAPAPMTSGLDEMLHPGKHEAKREPKHQKREDDDRPGKHRRPDHIVRVGDTLSEIAEANDCTWQELWHANRESVSNPRLINPGLRLTIPV